MNAPGAPDPWFRVDKTGLAAAPINAKGWALLGGYVVAIIVGGVLLFGLMGPSGTAIAMYLVATLTLTVVLVVVSYRRTEGIWAWQRKKGAGRS